MTIAMKLASAAMAVALSTSAQAATVSVADWQSAGDGLLTVDEGTGLAWLDLSQTQGLSVEQVLAGSWASQGFRLATSAEVLTLAHHGAQTDQSFVTWLGGQAAPADLSAYLGGPTILLNGVTAPATIDGEALSERFTLLQTVNVPRTPEPGDQPDPGEEIDPGSSAYTSSLDSGAPSGLTLPPLGGIPAYFFRVQQGSQALSSSSADTGVFLVRAVSAVPEPSTWLLMAAGLLAVSGAARAGSRGSRAQG